MQANSFEIGENVGVINSDVLNFGSLTNNAAEVENIEKEIVIFS